MKKIPSIFNRDWNGNRTLVTQEPNPECAWVFAGEGTPTRKWDGTSCLVQGGKLFKRYELKLGKTPPDGFIPAQDVDTETGKQPGWVPVGEGPDDAYHRLAWNQEIEDSHAPPADGTYELVGPKVQGNPDVFEGYALVRHGAAILASVPRTFKGLKDYLSFVPMEGIVWHHPDGRMAKIKSRDLGIAWPPKPA